MESLKFLKEIILPYVKTKRERLGLETQPALLIYDIFWGQTTDKFMDVLKHFVNKDTTEHDSYVSTTGFNRKQVR